MNNTSIEENPLQPKNPFSWNMENTNQPNPSTSFKLNRGTHPPFSQEPVPSPPLKTATTGFSFGGAPQEVSISPQIQNFKAEREKSKQKTQKPAKGIISSSHQPLRQQLPPSLPQRPSSTVQNTIVPTSTNYNSKSTVTKLLLLVSLASKKGNLTIQEKGKLKDLIIMGNPLLTSALEVFEIDQDFEELIDTFKRISKLA
jgi:hypothetical protein